MSRFPSEKLTTLLELTEAETRVVYDALVEVTLQSNDAAAINRANDIIVALDDAGLAPLPEIF